MNTKQILAALVVGVVAVLLYTRGRSSTMLSSTADTAARDNAVLDSLGIPHG